MKRTELEHIIRTVAAITDSTEVGIVGSQSVLGQFPTPPWELLGSMKADVFTFRNPADVRLIEGCLGEGSAFHQTFGYYAHGVSQTLTGIPLGWQRRLIPLRNENTGGATGLCLEVHDLAVFNLVAGNEEGLAFAFGLLRHGLVDASVIRARLNQTLVPEDRKTSAATRLRQLIEVNET